MAGYSSAAAPGDAGAGMAHPGRQTLAVSSGAGTFPDGELLHRLHDLYLLRAGVFCLVHLPAQEYPAVAAVGGSLCILLFDRRRTVRLDAFACLSGTGAQLQRQQPVSAEGSMAAGLAGHAFQSAELSAAHLPGGIAQCVLRHAVRGAVLCLCVGKADSAAGKALCGGAAGIFVCKLQPEHPELHLARISFSGSSTGQTVFYLYI